MVSEWSPMAKVIIILLRLSDKNERSNELQTLLQWQHHLLASCTVTFSSPMNVDPWFKPMTSHVTQVQPGHLVDKEDHIHWI